MNNPQARKTNSFRFPVNDAGGAGKHRLAGEISKVIVVSEEVTASVAVVRELPLSTGEG